MLTIHYGRRPDAETPLARTVRAGGWLRRLAARLGALQRSRRTLLDLDDAMLRDIGMTRDEARAESRRPVWEVPEHWRLR